MSKKIYYIEYYGENANGAFKDAGYVYDNPEDCLSQIDKFYQEDIENGCFENRSYSMWVEDENEELVQDEMVDTDPVDYEYDISEEAVQSIERDGILYSLDNTGCEQYIKVSIKDSTGQYRYIWSIMSGDDNTNKDWHQILGGDDPTSYWDDGMGNRVGVAVNIDPLCEEISKLSDLSVSDIRDKILIHNDDGHWTISGYTDVDDAMQQLGIEEKEN